MCLSPFVRPRDFTFKFFTFITITKITGNCGDGKTNRRTVEHM